MENYIFYGVSFNSIISAVNGTPITPTSVSSFIQSNPEYSLKSTDVNCNCASVETWLTLTSPSTGTFTLTVGNDTIVGAIYGPIPPRRPSVNEITN